MVRTTGARHRTYDEVSNRAVVVDKAIGLRTGVDKPRNVPLRVDIKKLQLKVMLIAKRVQISSGFFDSHIPPPCCHTGSPNCWPKASRRELTIGFSAGPMKASSKSPVFRISSRNSPNRFVSV